MKRKCIICGTEYESNGRKNEKPHCGNKKCKSRHEYKLKLKRESEVVKSTSVKIDLPNQELLLQIEELKKENEALKSSQKKEEYHSPSIEEIEEKYSSDINLNNSLCDAILVISKYIKKSEELQKWRDKESEIFATELDLRHILEFAKIKTPSESNKWLAEYKEMLVKRRIAKTRISIYEALKCISGFDNINLVPLKYKNSGVYNPRMYDLEPITKGDEINLLELKLKNLNTDDIIYSEEYQEYVNDINSSEIKNKHWARNLCFVDGSLNDLKTKISQMESKYSKFRVGKGVLSCYN